ncbi:HNH endonuclease [Gluconobacter kondonii]|uniref:HNH endonuclease n=1 Tax=Gluconobacter kondonii TaxID=941463 RepID=UPI001B8B819F|nr:HNH endonuclease [Gluconobacter kondonii]MBS1078078.1 HNH endonuclease [Gluconobacter kondonii]
MPGGPPKSRNPAWTRDEIILALDLYRKLNGICPAVTDLRVIELSRTLNILGQSFSHSDSTFRNANGVVMKLMNLRAHDPAYTAGGLKAGNRLEKEVWEDFGNDSILLQKVAHTIRAQIGPKGMEEATAFQINLDDEEGEEATEGKILTALHRRRERSPKLTRRKKEQVLSETGRLSCEACGFNFAQVYGERGKDFIECHHTKPLSDLNQSTKTKIEDLALVCANCHRMIHNKRPWLSISEIILLLQKT